MNDTYTAYVLPSAHIHTNDDYHNLVSIGLHIIHANYCVGDITSINFEEKLVTHKPYQMKERVRNFRVKQGILHYVGHKLSLRVLAKQSGVAWRKEWD